MATVKYLSPGDINPQEDHLLIMHRPRSGGFEVSIFAQTAPKEAGFKREIVSGELADALRVAQARASECGVDTIYVMGRPPGISN